MDVLEAEDVVLARAGFVLHLDRPEVDLARVGEPVRDVAERRRHARSLVGVFPAETQQGRDVVEVVREKVNRPGFLGG